jgi:hypothetical protein
MSGYAFALGPCLVCRRPFTFNPRRVPSCENEPICEPCIHFVNQEREKRGLPPWPVPEDAYQPLPEHEL